MGSECKMNEIETISEFTSRTYKYKLEYLSQKEAGSLDAASGSHCEQEKLYLLFKGKTGTENLLKLDWFQFTKDRMK